MRVVFVTPRYDPAAIGGAEAAARRLAERLAAEPGFEVAAYSTCAVDHLTWANELPEGTTLLNGVEVTRFAVAEQRQHEFFKTDGRLRLSPRRVTWEQSQRWLELNGPKAPGLIDAVASTDAHVAVFSPYLFWVTVAGIRASRAPSVLHCAAHDEPPLYFPAIGDAFERADALCYYTAAERRLVQRIHPVADKPQIVLGLGLGDPVVGGRRGQDVLGIGDRPYLLCLGRVEDHKGSAMLDTFFRRYKDRRPGPLALAHVGPVASSSELQPHPDVVITGAVDEAAKGDLLRDATALVSPSALESFSLVIMEAWEQGVPVVVNALCEPTRDHCAHSCGGMWFGSYRQFEVVLDRLLGDEELRHWLGANGRAYVQEHFQWSSLVPRYARFLTSVVERGPVGSR
jgi:glycosyltransferase involved in cell wall biosynthesis